MKALRIIFLFFLGYTAVQAQVYKDSWALGFGLTIPRYIGTEVMGTEKNIGIHSSLQVNLSEHSNFRAISRLEQLKIYKNNSFQNIALVFGFDYLFHLTPCEKVNPFVGAGCHGTIYKISGNKVGVKNNTYLDYEATLLFGVQWGIFDEWLGKDWKIKSELGIHTNSTDQFDGKIGPASGIFGGGLDSYFTFDVGVLWYFSAGTKAKYCDLYEGIEPVKAGEGGKGEAVDYNRIDDIVKKYAGKPADVDYRRIEEIIKKIPPGSTTYIQSPSTTGSTETYTGNGNWVLIGINFDPGKTSFRPEAYPMLINAAQILLSNTALKVEIQGHTDNVGSEEANNKLSLERAESVKRFLVAKGVDDSRLTTLGLGASQPIGDNSTAEGKAFNRRIEFRIVQ